jgi:hypothetical protein
MKECRRCKIEKPLELFAKRAAVKDGRASWCKACYAEHAALTYKLNESERERKARNKARTETANKKKIWEYLNAHACVDCGITDPRVLEFDHVDEKTKSFNVCTLFGYSWSIIQAEIDKCEVRCANCHRIRTQLQFGTWRGMM